MAEPKPTSGELRTIMSDGHIIVDTPEGIAFFQMAAILGRLKMEDRGLRFRQPTLAFAIKKYDLKAKTRKAAIKELSAKVDAILAAR